jgi:hypothetical protein
MESSTSCSRTEVVYKGENDCNFECSCGYKHQPEKGACRNSGRQRQCKCASSTSQGCNDVCSCTTVKMEEKSSCCANTAGNNNACSSTTAQGVTLGADFYYTYNPVQTGPGTSIMAGQAIPFPSDGVSTASSNIMRLTDSIFRLVKIGTYKISFVIGVNGPSQVILRVSGAEIPSTVFGTPIAGQLVGVADITTTVENATVGLYNPTGNAVLVYGGASSGNRSSTFHLTIEYFGSM